MKIAKCKICRRLGVSVCGKEKCALKRRPYPPGQKGKRKPRPLSEYGKELKEKQKLRNWYNLKERQFRKYVKEVLEKRGKVEDAAALLIRILENRLDNVVFRLGFASSRPQSRQMISHGHFLVNGKEVNIPSYSVKKGDVISVSPSSLKTSIFQNLKPLLKKHKTLSWFELDVEKMEGKIIGDPKPEEVAPPVEISVIFEYYSK